MQLKTKSNEKDMINNNKKSNKNNKRKITIIFFMSIIFMGIVVVANQLWPVYEENKKLSFDEMTSQLETCEDGMDITEYDSKNAGYNLPVEDEEQAAAEADCIAALDKIHEVYLDYYLGNSLDECQTIDLVHTTDENGNRYVMLTDDIIGEMVEVLGKEGVPVSRSDRLMQSMPNYEKMHQFLLQSSHGKQGEVVLYEICESGGLNRKKFSFDGEEMYVLNCAGTWNYEGRSSISRITYNRIEEWEYTEKGWFCYTVCVPEPGEGQAEVNGNSVLRIKPVNQEYQEFCEKWLLPIGYQRNNLFSEEWDAEQMENLKYNELYEYFYVMKYGKSFDSKQFSEGIPKEEFEALMISYLPVSKKQLQTYAVYDSDSETYVCIQEECRDYAVDGFGTSIPEITDICEQADGTIIVTADVVCGMAGEDAVYTHEVILKFMEDGNVMYLGNHLRK